MLIVNMKWMLKLSTTSTLQMEVVAFDCSANVGYETHCQSGIPLCRIDSTIILWISVTTKTKSMI